MAYSYFYAIAYLLCYAQLSFAGQSHVGNKVQGDQTVGGIHLFELHAPGGGIGLGIKVLLIGGLILAVLYWYMRRQTVKAIKRSAIPAIGTELAEVVAHRPQRAIACDRYCRRHNDDVPYEPTATTSARLP